MRLNISTKLNRIYNGTIDIGALLAGLLLIFLMLSVTLDVILRYFFDSPTSWVVETAGYSLLYIPFLVAAWVQRGEDHVTMDLVLHSLSPKTQSLVNTITSFVSAVICFLLTWHGIRMTLYFFKLGYKTPTVLMVPKSMIIAIIFIGSFFLCIQFLIRSYRQLMTWRQLRHRGN
ncbi:MAG: TRAP transporter small permease [Deltaproteobacteria bacterium]|nr:TRAP transporter small permease [Deltaproteobacteria bacterium]